nr:unnamed protein product [Spirometra erinaceieuropaei]
MQRYKEALKISLRRPRIGPRDWKTSPQTDNLAEDSEDRRRALLSQPHHRRQSQTQSSDISTAPASQRKQSTVPDLPTMPEDVPCTDRSYWTTSYQLQHPDDPTRCPPSAPPLSPTSTINSDRPSEPPVPSSSVAKTSTATASAPTATAPSNANLTTATISDVDSVHTCPHCDRTFSSHIGLVGHLRIHRTATGEPVPGAPLSTRRIRLNCPHCARTFTRRMGL